jgi:hypothetical protein
MTWVEVIVIGCILALLVSPFVSAASRKVIRIVCAFVLVGLLALYGAEIVSNLL